MAALLLEQRQTEPPPGERFPLLDQLRSELTALRAEVDALRRDNLELRQHAGYWKSMHAGALERLTAVEQENAHLRGEVARLNAQLFGQKSEKQSRKDRSNHLDGLDDEDGDGGDSKPKSAPRPRQGPQRRDFRHLPARAELVELPEAEQVCPRCGQPWRERSDTEDSEQIEIEVQAYRRVLRRRRYQATCTCAGCQTRTAPPPPKLIPKSRLGTSVWVEILLDKYASHRPTERLLAAWEHLGLGIAASTVAGGLARLGAVFWGLPAEPQVLFGGEAEERATTVRHMADAGLRDALGAPAVEAFARKLGKEPVVIGDRAGFIANALLFGYLNHAVSMYEAKYATREDIDAAMRLGCGLQKTFLDSEVGRLHGEPSPHAMSGADLAAPSIMQLQR